MANGIFFLNGNFKRLFFFVVLPLALAGAGFALWPSEPFQEFEFFVPIDYGKPPAGLMISGNRPNGIEVRVRARKSDIRALYHHPLRYGMDIPAEEAGWKELAVKPDWRTLPKGVSVIGVKPERISLRIENEITKQVPIEIVLSGKPPTDYIVAGAAANPTAVFLRGPKSYLSLLEKVNTKPVEVSGISESFKREIALDLPPDAEVIYPSGILRAHVFVEEKIVTRKYESLTVVGSGSPLKCMITPPTIDLSLRGPTKTLDKITAENSIDVYVDLKGLKPGIYPCRATIVLPARVNLTDSVPKLFTVTIK